MENRVVLQSFDWNTLRIMKQVNPNISTSALWSQQPSWGRDSENLRPYEEGASPWLGGTDIDDYKGDAVAAAHAIGADVISPYYEELSAEKVAEAHSLGMKVVLTASSPTSRGFSAPSSKRKALPSASKNRSSQTIILTRTTTTRKTTRKRLADWTRRTDTSKGIGGIFPHNPLKKS